MSTATSGQRTAASSPPSRPVNTPEGEPEPATDLSAASSAKAPPAVTFDVFYRAHAATIGQALEITLGDRELAEDALSEAMARALQRWTKVASYANPQGWVYRVALNWARSWHRRRRREQDRPVDLASPSADPTAGDDELRQAIRALPVDHRAVVVCRYLLDWSTSQTAAALDVPEGTVKSRLARALGSIRASLQQDTNERSAE